MTDPQAFQNPPEWDYCEWMLFHNQMPPGGKYYKAGCFKGRAHSALIHYEGMPCPDCDLPIRINKRIKGCDQ